VILIGKASRACGKSFSMKYERSLAQALFFSFKWANSLNKKGSNNGQK